MCLAKHIHTDLKASQGLHRASQNTKSLSSHQTDMALTEMAPLVTRGWSPSISIPIFHIFVIPFQAYSLLVGRDSLSSRYQLEKLAGNFGAWGEKAGSEMPDIPCHPVLAHSLQHLDRS